MQILESETVVMCDIDDTILMWNTNYKCPSLEGVKTTCPYSGEIRYLRPHYRHIELLKQYKARGFTIVFWSAAGYLWAKEAVNVLGLNDITDLIMTKPIKYLDDLQASEILGARIYIKEKE